jgi:uncharacterized OB-fold protein
MNKPIPNPTPETAPYWQGCAEGELRLQHCEDCGHVQFPPRRLCSGCFSQAVLWRKAAGTGTLRSWSMVTSPADPAFAGEVPFMSALIELDEGPTMLSVVRNCAPESAHIGMRLEVEFEQRSEQIAVPYFHPA